MGEYEFASVFSYRIPNLSPSFALSTPLPGPSTFKLALVSNAIEMTGNVQYGAEIFEKVKTADFMVQPPKRLATYRTLIKRLKQDVTAKKKEQIGKCVICGQEKKVRKVYGELVCKDCGQRNTITSTFGTREYVHFYAPIKIYINVKQQYIEEIKQISGRIRRLGTSDSICTPQKIEESQPDIRNCARPFQTQNRDQSAEYFTKVLVLTMLDIDKDANFDHVNPYAHQRLRRPKVFVPVSYIFPLVIEKEGQNWSQYVLQPFE